MRSGASKTCGTHLQPSSAQKCLVRNARTVVERQNFSSGSKVTQLYTKLKTWCGKKWQQVIWNNKQKDCYLLGLGPWRTSSDFERVSPKCVRIFMRVVRFLRGSQSFLSNTDVAGVLSSSQLTAPNIQSLKLLR